MLGWSYSDQSWTLMESSFVLPWAPTVEGDMNNPKSKANTSHLRIRDLQNLYNLRVSYHATKVG